ncbi:metal-dependent hydrolase [Paenibacillus sp. FSL H7-0716]|uniref:Metal-dependent hydrolase n=1 Tax=Paenibacillus odorifer TaxID=189426 RepID=A0AB36J5B6_9BACL|nr:metal-dependent hydrolase [Paenibacillus odorifer]OME07457.1 hypothetical protein BSK60_31545 [Paenibacillus odorifer]OME10254.1 hypothetical protein BSK47_31015 [Paenibacillus odorifer]
MNKKGHVALAAIAGSLSFYTALHSKLWNPSHEYIGPLLILSVGAAITGGLAPDLDHKTSTASQHIQFSVQKRRFFRLVSVLMLVVGVILLALKLYEGDWRLSVLPAAKNALICLVGSLIFFMLANMRNIVLSGVGITLLAMYSLYGLHWITAFAGLGFLMLPVVKHRGIIHTPEYAIVMSLGIISFSFQQSDTVQILAIGFLTGWWAHLVGDCFGSDGIHSLIIPKLKIGLHLFSNGGTVERWISRICWCSSLIVWVIILTNQALPNVTFFKTLNFLQ